jgi:hypothetical protein
MLRLLGKVLLGAVVGGVCGAAILGIIGALLTGTMYGAVSGMMLGGWMGAIAGAFALPAKMVGGLDSMGQFFGDAHMRNQYDDKDKRP